MPEDKAESLEVKKTTGVPREANAWDKTTVAGIISGGGLAVYLAFVVIPDLTKAVKDLTVAVVECQKANEAHYRAMSDDRRTQFDKLDAKVTGIDHNVRELRRLPPEAKAAAMPEKP